MFSKERFENVSWKDLQTASGTATHVPDALLGLISDDAQIREKSYWQLDNEVVCQSDLYESAFYVVPHLISLLEDPEVRNRLFIYDLLFEIANGYAPEEVSITTSEGLEVPLTDACRQGVKNGTEVYRNDSKSGNDELASKARDLLDLLNQD